MRFHLPARRMILAPALVLPFAAAIAAYSSSSSSSVFDTAAAADRCVPR
jgi:hypothetical protein